MQAKEILFSCDSDQHVCKALSYLSTNLVPCTDPELDYFQQKLSSHFYPFRLISEHNLLCLRTFLQVNQLSTPNIEHQANLQVLLTQSSLVWPHYLPYKAITSAKSNQLFSYRNQVASIKISATLTKNSGASIQEFTFKHQSVLYSLVEDVGLAPIVLVQLKVDLDHLYFHYYKSLRQVLRQPL